MGPLSGFRVLELAGIGPGPFCGMVLADLGADVLRIDRAQSVRQPIPDWPNRDLLARGRRSIGVDLKSADGVEIVLRLVEQADALIEGFRPGVTERLGVGPDVCLARNPKLVYGRMTGWGQDGPYAQASGHDINYIALAGALRPLARAGEKPLFPLNLLGDFGGGGMLLALGVVAALLECSRSGAGQVVDAAMVDGAALLTTFVHGMRAMGAWSDEPGTNLLDSGAPFYEVYECADGEYIAIGSLEPQFFAELMDKTPLGDDPELRNQMNKPDWPAHKERYAAIFATRTRAQWCEVLEASDACFAPVLSMEEAPRHPHNVARGTFVDVDGVMNPAPAPRFSRTPGAISRPPVHAGQDTDDALADWGFSGAEITKLREAGAIA